MPILLALTGLAVTGIFGLEKLTEKTDSAIETSGDLVKETLLPAFFFWSKSFYFKQLKEKKHNGFFIKSFQSST